MSSGESPKPAIGMPMVVAVAGSAGSLQPVLQLLAGLPRWLSASVVIALHPQTGRTAADVLATLQRQTDVPVQWALHGERLMRRRVYLVTPGTYAMLDLKGQFHVLAATGARQAIIDALLHSVARACGPRCVGVVLSGSETDGALGARAIGEAGGTVIVQDRSSSEAWRLPSAALSTGVAALILPFERIAAALATLLNAPGSQAWFRVQPASPYGATAR
jgi:two-component system chemotaxis response regulator CheB